MLVTVTNVSSATINTLQTITGGVGVAAVLAVGGQRTNPLPYPFGHIGDLAASGTKQLAMHPRDWRYKCVPGMPLDAGEEWQSMIQRGIVTLAYAAQTGRRDAEELFVTAV